MVSIWNSVSLKYWTDWYIQERLKDKMAVNCLRKWLYLRKVRLQVDDSCIMRLEVYMLVDYFILCVWVFWKNWFDSTNIYSLNLCTAGCFFFVEGGEQKRIVLIEMKHEILLEIYCYLLILTYPNLGSTVIYTTYPYKLHASPPPFTWLQLHSEWHIPGVTLGSCIMWKVSKKKKKFRTDFFGKF